MAGKAADPHVAHVCYAYLINGSHHLPTVARKAGMSASKLYSICEGRRSLPPEDIPRLYAATGDLRFYAELVGAGDVGVVLSRAPAAETVDELRGGGLSLAADVGNALQTLRDALADDRIDHRERRQILEKLDLVMSAAQGLKLSVAGSER